MPRKSKVDAQSASAQAGHGSLSSLNPTPYNPRKQWGDGRDKAFTKSLAVYGDIGGIVFNRTTGTLVGGNKRTEAFSSDAGAVVRLTEVLATPDKQGSVAFGYVLLSDGSRFAYREVQWDLAKEKAANIAANKWSAEWNWEGVSTILQELNSGQYDLETTGFQQHELDAMLAADWKPPEVTPMEPHSHHDSVHLVLTKEQHALFEKAKAKAIHDGAAQDVTDGEVVALMVEAYLNAA